MFRSISFQSCALYVLLSFSLTGSLDKNNARVLAMRTPEGTSSLLEAAKFDISYHVAPHDSSRQLCGVQPNHESQLTRSGMVTNSNLKRLTSSNQPSCIGFSFVEKMMTRLRHGKNKPLLTWRKGSSSPDSKRLQTPQQGSQASEKLSSKSPDGSSSSIAPSSAEDDVGFTRNSVPNSISALGPEKELPRGSIGQRKTADWPSDPELLEKDPSGEEAVEKYIKQFNSETFTRYIAKQGQLSSLKKLTEASKDTTPDQFAKMIHALEPMAMGNILSVIKAQNSNPFQPMFMITAELKKGTKNIVLKTMEEHLKRNEDFENPAHNLWMFLRSLKEKLYQREDEKAKEVKHYKKWSYDSSLLENSVRDMFKEASQKSSSESEASQELSSEASRTRSPIKNPESIPEPWHVNHDVLDKIADKMTDEIHSAMIGDGHPNLTEEQALYIRQCLASVHTFTLKYKSCTTTPLPNAISGYYSRIFQRYSDTPELRHLAYRLHQQFNLRLPERDRHDIIEISLDDHEDSKGFI